MVRGADPSGSREFVLVQHCVGHRAGRTGSVDGSTYPSAPMTYLHQGRQYIAVATGGGPRAEIVAFAVP